VYKLIKKWFSSLATITDQFENDFVTAMMYGEQTNYDLNFNSYAGAWIGYHGYKDADNVVSFNWMDDYFSSTYTKWYYGEPAVEFTLPETELCIYMLPKNDLGKLLANLKYSANVQAASRALEIGEQKDLVFRSGLTSAKQFRQTSSLSLISVGK
jgi:hypothetical protein